MLAVGFTLFLIAFVGAMFLQTKRYASMVRKTIEINNKQARDRDLKNVERCYQNHLIRLVQKQHRMMRQMDRQDRALIREMVKNGEKRNRAKTQWMIDHLGPKSVLEKRHDTEGKRFEAYSLCEGRM